MVLGCADGSMTEYSPGTTTTTGWAKCPDSSRTGHTNGHMKLAAGARLMHGKEADARGRNPRMDGIRAARQMCTIATPRSLHLTFVGRQVVRLINPLLPTWIR